MVSYGAAPNFLRVKKKSGADEMEGTRVVEKMRVDQGVLCSRSGKCQTGTSESCGKVAFGVKLYAP